MSSRAVESYAFADFHLDLKEKVLLRGNTPVPLTPKVFDTLVILVSNAGHLVTKSSLMDDLWPDSFVDENNLSSNIKLLRKALGDNADAPRFIETVPRRGYRFIATVVPERPSSAPTGEITLRGRRILITITAILVVSVAVIGVLWVMGGKAFRSRSQKSIRLTTNGKATVASIAPDGTKVLFSQKEDGGESLWLRQIESGELVRITSPSHGEYTGLAISPDGRYGYFSFFSENNAAPTLTRVELSGDHSLEQLGIDTDDAVSFSPDGRRLAYVETHTSTKEIDVMTANADGGDRSVLLKTVGDSRIIPYFRSAPLAWSTDGTTIACAVRERSDTGIQDRIILIDANSGNERYLTERVWMRIDSLVWAAQNKLAFIGSEPDSRSREIWVISIDTGEARPLTDDQFNYEWLSAGKGELLAVQKSAFSSLHVAERSESGELASTKQILGEVGEIDSVAWSRQGKLLYNSAGDGSNDIWEVNADGTSPHSLTNGSGLTLTFTVSPTDGSVVFSSLGGGRVFLAMVDANGSDFRRLTEGPFDQGPVFTPNGEEIVFQRGSLQPNIWKISLRDGGYPTQITGYQSTDPFPNADGKEIAFHFMDYGSKHPKWRLGFVDAATHRLVRKLDFPVLITDRRCSWDPKSGRLTFAYDNGGDAALILWAPIDDSPKEIDGLGVGRIGSFAWSPDGNRLAYSQVIETGDVIVLRGQ